MRSTTLLLSLATVAACGSATPAPSTPAPPPVATSPAPAPEASEHLSPPFTAADLRASLPVGTEIRLRVELAGEAPVIQHWTVTAADDSGCTIHARVLAEDGSLLEDQGEGTSTWAELETHAHFPAARTTRTDASVDVPAGHFETWLFEVQPEQPGGPIKRLHFARDLPGPPVFMAHLQGGVAVMTMQLVSRTQP